MANFVKKMLDRTRSRSKSPVKRSTYNFQPWPHNTIANSHYQLLPVQNNYFPYTYHRNTFEETYCGVGNIAAHNITDPPANDTLLSSNRQSSALSLVHAPIAAPEFTHTALSSTHSTTTSVHTPPHNTPSVEQWLSGGRKNIEYIDDYYGDTQQPNSQSNKELARTNLTSRASQTSLGSTLSDKHHLNQTTTANKEASGENQSPDSRETGLNYRSVQSYARYENQQQPCDIHSTRATLSPAATANDSQVQPRLVMPDYGTLDSARSHMSRPRSFSPVKTPRTPSDTLQKKSRSKSPRKKNAAQITSTIDYLSSQCQTEGCCAAILVQDTRFLVCKYQLSHASEYFRSLFLANKSLPLSGAHQCAMNEFAIVVSSFQHPPPATQFRWFLECAVQAPILKDISDETLETCMRLSKRFKAQGLEMRCARYIQENVNKKSPMVALCWLNWVLKHKFDRASHDACLPCVASASLQCLEQHRNMITEKLLADLLAAKLRMLYDQAVNVFKTIHTMDHFSVDVDRCPRCGRQRDQGRVRINASPCRRIIGCERCTKEYGCEITAKAKGDLQAYYQCQHGLTALNDTTPDCQCQLPMLASYLSKSTSSIPSSSLPNGPVNS